MNHILIKYGTTDPDKILDLIDINDPEYLAYALRYKKYDRICIKDLQDQVVRIEFRNQNLFNIINKNNTKINEIKNHIKSVVMD
jgi:NADH dehydrogenase/NADH:ubiquinone oxidoreductase subunit G